MMPTPVLVDNPFSGVYSALWRLVDDSTRMSSLVRLGNRIRYDHSTPGPSAKAQISNADLPELVLISTGSSGNIHQTSSTSSFIRTYEWLLSTGQQSMTNSLLPVEWALFCALENWKHVITQLTWPNEHWYFVKRMSLMSVANGLADGDRNRGMTGWSAIWSVEVEMHFKSADMRAYNLGSG